MLFTRQMHRATDLVQSVLGNIQIGNYERAETDARLLARVIADLQGSPFFRLFEEIREDNGKG